MRKTIIIISIFTCFLMLMIPTINAVEMNAIKNQIPSYIPEYTKEELENAILKRIEQMRDQNIVITIFGLNWTDPDGAFEGGLDDLTDILALLYGIYWSGVLIFFIKERILLNSESLLEFIEGIITYADLSLLLLVYFGEAFDVVDLAALDNR